MDLHVDVVKVSLKTKSRFKLHCKAEASDSGEIQTETSFGNLLGTISEEPQQQNELLLPKFRFHFREPGPNLVALLFTAVSTASDEAGSTELGQCLFPITFRGLTPTDVTPLDLAAADIIKQTQIAILTTKVEGTAINKVVGKVWFKVNSMKPAPRPKPMKAQQSILNMKIVQEQLQLQSSLSSALFPRPVVISELVARESEAACLAPTPIDKPTIAVVFHCIRSMDKFTAPGNLNPIACIGSTPDIKNDTLFTDSDNKETSVIPMLKTVTLKCRNEDDLLELHVAKKTLLFSAGHQIDSLVPFKHYNWKYDWRWTLEPSVFNPSQSLNSQEPFVMVSVVHRPSASDYLDYEGLELLVHGLEINSSLEDKSIVLCTRLLSSSDGIGEDNEEGSPSDNVNISVIRFKSASTMITIPSYYFFPADPYFDSARKDAKKLSVTLYVTDESNAHLWWDTREIASVSLPIPANLQKALRSQENQGGVYWELTRADITQSVMVPVTNEISGVIRWKEKNLEFMSSEIESQLSNLPAYSDLIATRALSAVSSASSSPSHTDIGALVSLLEHPQTPLHVHEETESIQPNEEDYKTALTKMGMDILALRQENLQLKQEKEQLEKNISTNVQAVSVENQSELQSLSKADLVHKVSELSQHLSLEIKTRKSCQEKVRDLNNKLIKTNDYEVQYLRLQEIHTAQQKLVHELQAKVEKYRKCYDTCKQQEMFIKQLESLLAHQGHSDSLSALKKKNPTLAKYQIAEHDSPRKLSQENSPRKLSQENSQRRLSQENDKDTIKLLQTELEKTKEKCRALEKRVGTSSQPPQTKPSRSGEQNQRITELEEKLKVATTRQDALTSEFAKNWVQEKTRYELALAEYKSRVDTLERRLGERDRQKDSRESEHSQVFSSRSQHRRVERRLGERDRQNGSRESVHSEVFSSRSQQRRLPTHPSSQPQGQPKRHRTEARFMSF